MGNCTHFSRPSENANNSQVWNKIKVGIEQLIDFLGFMFDWDDILATKETVSSLITAGCDLAARKVGIAADTVDIFFKDVLAKIDGIEVKKDVSASSNSGKGGDEKSTTVKDAQNSTSFNWAGERMKNGGMKSSQEVAKPGEIKPDLQQPSPLMLMLILNSATPNRYPEDLG